MRISFAVPLPLCSAGVVFLFDEVGFSEAVSDLAQEVAEVSGTSGGKGLLLDIHRLALAATVYHLWGERNMEHLLDLCCSHLWD